jgi:hypothetical protein
LRDQCEAGRFLKIKKPPDFANEEWRKFDEPPKNGLGGLASSFSLRRSVGEVDRF